MSYTFIADRHPGNLDWSMLSKRGCSRCNALAGEPHTFRCADMRVEEARSGLDRILDQFVAAGQAIEITSTIEIPITADNLPEGVWFSRDGKQAWRAERDKMEPAGWRWVPLNWPAFLQGDVRPDQTLLPHHPGIFATEEP